MVSKAPEGNVMVVCRFRPFNEKEIQMGQNKCVAHFNDDHQHLDIKTQVNSFILSHTYRCLPG